MNMKALVVWTLIYLLITVYFIFIGWMENSGEEIWQAQIMVLSVITFPLGFGFVFIYSYILEFLSIHGIAIKGLAQFTLGNLLFFAGGLIQWVYLVPRFWKRFHKQKSH